jgi:hypothetical protein
MNKKFLLGAFVLASFSYVGKVAAAPSSSVESSITPMLGFNQGQFVLGLDYEKALNPHVGFGGYFAFSPEKKEADMSQMIALGVDVKVHAGFEKWDVYIRPGFGLAFASLDSESKTYLAPVIGLGVQYAVSEKTLIGIEKLTFFNWTEATDLSAEALVATVRVKF